MGRSSGGGGRSSGGGGSTALDFPAGTSITKLENGARIYAIDVNGSSVEVMIFGLPGEGFDINFTVAGTYAASDISRPNSAAISQAVAKIVRADISRRPEGTKFKATAYSSDGRGLFRQAMYARAGFSFAGGSSKFDPDNYGSGYAVVRGGKAYPSNQFWRPFNAQQLAEHSAGVRAAIRIGIREARGESF